MLKSDIDANSQAHEHFENVLAAAANFMSSQLRMENSVIGSIRMEGAWFISNSSSLVVKFSCKEDIDIVNSFKKNLPQNSYCIGYYPTVHLTFGSLLA